MGTRNKPRREGYNDYTSTPLVKADLDSALEGFGEVVRANARAGTLEAINEHKKECKNDNDGRYVQKDTCQKRREICKTNIDRKIDNKCTDGHHCPGDEMEEDPAINISITAKAFNHFKKYKLTYGLGSVSLLELIGLVVMLIRDYIHIG